MLKIAVLVISALLTIQAYAGTKAESCETYLESVLKYATQPLSAVEMKALKQASFRKLQTELGDGRGVVFRSYFFSNSEADITKVSSLYKGEYQSSRFVRRYLAELFPAAEFKYQEDAPGRRAIAIKISDVAEHEADPRKRAARLKLADTIPMHLIKPAMSVPIIPDKLATRAALGLSSTQKVLSLYIRAPEILTDIRSRAVFPETELPQLMDQLRKGFDFDVLIVSFGNLGFASFRSAGFIFTNVRNWKVENLSDLTRNGHDAIPSNTLIYNDTIGRMPYMHAAADLAVVVGPINFFEPIGVGTPTLIFEKSNSRTMNADFRSYGIEEYRYQIDLALKTGLAETTSKYAEVPDKIRFLLAKPLTEGSSVQQLALPAFLKALRDHIRFSLKDSE